MADPGGAGGGSCNATSGCTGKLPPITGKCYRETCRLDNDLEQVIGFYATVYEIPNELLYVTLLTEYMDDRQPLQDAVDIYNLGNSVNALYGDPDHSEQGWAGLGLMELFEESRHPGENPGAGYNNIHRAAVWEAQDYFASYYPDSNMARLAQPDKNLPGTIMTLATTDGNIRYAAAYLRVLADKRTGSTKSHINDLTVTDQAIIYGAYRKGIQSYGGPGDFRAASQPGEMGRRYMWFYYSR